jgi:hypothetical protein
VRRDIRAEPASLPTQLHSRRAFPLIFRTFSATRGQCLYRFRRVLVLLNDKESDDFHDAFFQQNDFYYLTGWEKPGAIPIITPEFYKKASGYAQH